MDGVATRAARDVHELVDAKIAFARGSRTDGISLIGQADVERFAVGVAEDGDGLNAEFAAGADNAHRDLTAIGNQNFLEHMLLEMQRDSSMRAGEERRAHRLACRIVCGVLKCGDSVGGGQK